MTRRLGLNVLLIVCVVVFAVAGCGDKTGDEVDFIAEELIGTPTNDSVVINIVPGSSITYKYEYGTSSGSYESESATVTATGGEPSEITITDLTANTLYYYRMVYDGDGDIDDGDYVTRTEHSFRTGRAQGDGFVFTITADLHDHENSALWTNVLDSEPDLHFDLGDTFVYTQGNRIEQNTSVVNQSYLDYRDPTLMGMIGSSVPIFLVAGNHEDEEGWNLDDTPFSIGLASIQARKAFYPTPNQNDGFYSVNTDPLSYIDSDTYGDQMREDYFAWTWGDALFVVLDVYQYTMERPYEVGPGEGTDEEPIGDKWSWTLGKAQYDWLASVLQGSDAKYKFVLSHQVAGDIPSTTGYGRGGAEAAVYFEWGGYNADGTWGFDTERPGWEMPVHDLFVETGVTAYFHGHDHQYAYETRDGIVYQECPSGGEQTPKGGYPVGTYTDNKGTYEVIYNDLSTHGHLAVTVDSNDVTVDFINIEGSVAYSYTIDSNGAGDGAPTSADEDVLTPADAQTLGDALVAAYEDAGSPADMTPFVEEGLTVAGSVYEVLDKGTFVVVRIGAEGEQCNIWIPYEVFEAVGLSLADMQAWIDQDIEVSGDLVLNEYGSRAQIRIADLAQQVTQK